MRNVILTTRDGRRFLVAQLMDSLGGGLSSVVLPWLVLDAGGSGPEAGAAFLVGTVPYVLLGLPAGEVGDRRPRRRVMQVGVACQLLAALLIPVVVLAGTDARDLPLALIYAAGLGVTAGRVFVDAAAFGAIARLVGHGHFVEGQTALSFVWSLGLLIGPALGGALIGLVGADNALWVQAAGFALALVLITSMRVELGPGDERHEGVGGFASGLRLVLGHPMLRILTAVGMAWNLSLNMIYALLVVFARGQLGAGAPETGWMLAIGGGAGLIGGLSTQAVHRRFGAGRTLRGGLVASAAGVGAAGAVAQRLAGHHRLLAAGRIGTAVHHHADQRAADAGGAHEQARVGITGRMVALLAATLGALLGSALVAHMRPSSVFAVSATATVLVALAGQRLLREL